MRNPGNRHRCKKCRGLRKEKFMRIVEVTIYRTGKHTGQQRTVWECCDCASNPKNNTWFVNGVLYAAIPIDFKKPENGK